MKRKLKINYEDPSHHRGEVEKIVKNAKSKEDGKRRYIRMTFNDLGLNKQNKWREDDTDKDSYKNNRASMRECTKKSCHYDTCDSRWLTEQ